MRSRRKYEEWKTQKIVFKPQIKLINCNCPILEHKGNMNQEYPCG